MRFLGIGDTCDLGALYLRLLEDGHEVKVSVAEPLCQGVLAGLVPHAPDWRAELDWVRAAGRDGIILFENVAYERGALQDELRRDGLNVIGGSAYGDRLEKDRPHAQQVLSELGFPILRVWEFDEPDAAARFIAERPARYVFKLNGSGFAAFDNYVGRMPDGRDVAAFVRAKFREYGEEQMSFMLMEHVEGVEMGVGAYFDGEDFLGEACLDWEHKRFFPGDLGELTGEMGTVATYDRSRRFFDRTLGRLAPLLRAHGHCGYINLNTIVNDQGIWPLEFTCRFGYPGFAVLDPLQETSWAALFKAMATRSKAPLVTRPGFSVGVVMTTPPFPFIRRYVEVPIGLPILFEGDLDEKDRANLHYGEVGLEEGVLVTAGYHGWTLVVTGVGPTIRQAQEQAYALADRVVVPNVRYRRDIGDKLVSADLARVAALGLLDEA